MGDSNNTNPSVVVITPATTRETITSVKESTVTAAASGITTTQTQTSSVTIITSATTTSIPTDGIFVTTTAEIFIAITFIILLVTNIFTGLQYNRTRGKQDKREDLDKLQQVIIRGDGADTTNH